MKKIVVEQWKLFISRCGLQEDKLSPDQAREMKRALFGACGQLLIYLQDDVPADKKGITLVKAMFDECEQFWAVENITQDAIVSANKSDALDEAGFYFINPYANTGGIHGVVMLCRMNTKEWYAEFCYFIKGRWTHTRRVGQDQIDEAAKFRLPAKMDAILRYEMPLSD